MKAIRVSSSVVFVVTVVAAGAALGATARVSAPRCVAGGGVVLAGEYQVPVVEGVEPDDAPAVDADEGNREAMQPSAESAPPADVPPGVEQPPIEP